MTAFPGPAAPVAPRFDDVAPRLDGDALMRGALALGGRDEALREAIEELAARVADSAPAPPPHAPGRTPPTLSVSEAAFKLGVDRKSLYAMIARDEFPPAVRVGRRVVIPRAAFDAWMRDVGR